MVCVIRRSLAILEVGGGAVERALGKWKKIMKNIELFASHIRKTLYEKGIKDQGSPTLAAMTAKIL